MSELAKTAAPAKLTLGPILFNWDAALKRDFYYRIADEAPVDIVYLGEVVCSKRAPFLEPLIPDIHERLTRAGKEVVFSTLALIMTPREMAPIRALVAQPDLVVEANDIATASLTGGRPHVIGPFVNCYNEATLAFLGARGAIRLVPPGELTGAAIAKLAASRGATALEVQVFGRQPLALSSRCTHARLHGLHKDGCQYVCAGDSDGLDVETLDGEPFLALNGTQTLSHRLINLVAELADMRAQGVSHFRLWPHSCDMVEVARIYRQVLDGALDADSATAQLHALAGFAPVANGYYHAREGWRRFDPDQDHRAPA